MNHKSRIMRIRTVILSLSKDLSPVVMKYRGAFRITNVQQGFTFVEMILYVAIISIILTAIIPFTWNIVESATKSAAQQEVSSQVRVITERITYEIRNAVDIVSPNPGQAGNSLILCENTANCASASNQTIISLSGGSSGNVQIAIGGAAAVQLSSNSVVVPLNGIKFTNNSSSTTKNISFSLTLKQSYTGIRNEYIISESASSSAELRNL